LSLMTKAVANTFTYDYPRAAVTVDVVAFTLVDTSIRVLLIQRKSAPFAQLWALPGGFLEENEPIEIGTFRELKEETQLEPKSRLTWLGAFGDPGRDPRGWTISLASFVLIPPPTPLVVGSDDAGAAAWHDFNSLPPLAFDHEVIVRRAYIRLCSAIDIGDLGTDLLPASFTMTDVNKLFLALGETAEEAEHWRDYLLDIGKIEPAPRSKSKYRPVVNRPD